MYFQSLSWLAGNRTASLRTDTMEYELRWGKWTWMPALVIGTIIGAIILWLDFQQMGIAWHNGYYMAMLGYYVMFSICQSHYFKVKPEPSWDGLARQWVSITSAVLIFYVNDWMMREVVGIPGNLVMGGQFFFIVLGFFFFGMDDFMFKGALSKWIKKDAVKAIFWFIIIWVFWYILFAASWGLSRALGVFDALANNIFLGSFQWTIMMSMMIAITWRDFLESIKWKSDIQRGLVLLPFSLIMGLVLGYICVFFIDVIQPFADPDAMLSSVDKWHHVLYMGTFPLIPIILFGIYSNHFNAIPDVKKKVMARTAFIASMVILGYFIFHLVTSETGLFAVNGTNPHWFHSQDLIFNFTVSIIPLSHHWFCGRVWFLRSKRKT